jgi:hypothetical protein
MEETYDLPSVDHTVIKVGQVGTIVLLVMGFVVDHWGPVAAVAAINLIGLLSPALSLWRQLYVRVLRPLGLAKPNVVPDYPEPHRFAQGVGGGLALTATLMLLVGQAIVGWGLVWLHILLAALNLFVGFCLGCFVYYQMSRLGVPGFSRQAMEK